jgi:hypothetical protein
MTHNQTVHRVNLRSGAEHECTSSSPKLIRRQAVPCYLRTKFGIIYSAGAFAKFAVTGKGPRFCRAGRDAYYSPADLDAWAQTKLSDPSTFSSKPGTSSNGGGHE